jgi:hypothetical protein
MRNGTLKRLREPSRKTEGDSVEERLGLKISLRTTSTSMEVLRLIKVSGLMTSISSLSQRSSGSNVGDRKLCYETYADDAFTCRVSDRAWSGISSSFVDMQCCEWSPNAVSHQHPRRYKIHPHVVAVSWAVRFKTQLPAMPPPSTVSTAWIWESKTQTTQNGLSSVPMSPAIRSQTRSSPSLVERKPLPFFFVGEPHSLVAVQPEAQRTNPRLTVSTTATCPPTSLESTRRPSAPLRARFPRNPAPTPQLHLQPGSPPRSEPSSVVPLAAVFSLLPSSVA